MISAPEVPRLAPIRMVFELARADHPRLYDELIRFQKGTKRINRLRVLAYDGLLAQCGAQIASAPQPQTRERTTDAEEGDSTVTDPLFGPADAS